MWVKRLRCVLGFRPKTDSGRRKVEKIIVYSTTHLPPCNLFISRLMRTTKATLIHITKCAHVLIHIATISIHFFLNCKFIVIADVGACMYLQSAY